MEKIVITKMEQQHIETLVQLEKICFSQPWSYKSLEEELSNDTAYFFVALSGGDVLGYIGMFIVCESCFLANVAVFPEYRKKGIASALLKYVFDVAQSKGTDFVSLEVRKSNSNAISLYTSLGFQEMGIRKNYYQSPTEDALILTKLFNDNTVI